MGGKPQLPNPRAIAVALAFLSVILAGDLLSLLLLLLGLAVGFSPLNQSFQKGL
jgi:hypothetical protein